MLVRWKLLSLILVQEKSLFFINKILIKKKEVQITKGLNWAFSVCIYTENKTNFTLHFFNYMEVLLFKENTSRLIGDCSRTGTVQVLVPEQCEQHSTIMSNSERGDKITMKLSHNYQSSNVWLQFFQNRYNIVRKIYMVMQHEVTKEDSMKLNFCDWCLSNKWLKTTATSSLDRFWSYDDI